MCQIKWKRLLANMHTSVGATKDVQYKTATSETFESTIEQTSGHLALEHTATPVNLWWLTKDFSNIYCHFTTVSYMPYGLAAVTDELNMVGLIQHVLSQQASLHNANRIGPIVCGPGPPCSSPSTQTQWPSLGLVSRASLFCFRTRETDEGVHV